MSSTNLTTDKPAYEGSNDSPVDAFSIAKFCITILVVIAVQIWVNYVNRKKDKKDEKERFEKNERDKLVYIIDKGYDEIVKDGINENLRKCKENFEAMVMFYGKKIVENGNDENTGTVAVPIHSETSETPALQGEHEYKITGLDVLRFMLSNPKDFGNKRLRKLQQDLDAVVKLFWSLSIRLSPKSECPDNFKKELGQLITGLGEIAWSLIVSAEKRNTIAKVLKHFGVDKEDDKTNSEIERVFPYVKSLSLGYTMVEMLYHSSSLVPADSSYHDQDFYFVTFNIPSNEDEHTTCDRLNDIASYLREKEETIQAEDLRRFADKIADIWRREFQQLPMDTPDWSKEEHLRANILHAVRVFITKVKEGSDILQDENFKELVVEMWNTTYYVQDSDMYNMRSKRAIADIAKSLWNLKHYKQDLCKQESIAEMLEGVRQETREALV